MTILSIKHLNNFNENLKVRVGEFCLFVNDKKFTWSNGKLAAVSNDDTNYLRNVLSASITSVEVISATVETGFSHKSNSSSR